jgi:hypothetical protein
VLKFCLAVTSGEVGVVAGSVVFLGVVVAVEDKVTHQAVVLSPACIKHLFGPDVTQDHPITEELERYS